MPFKKIAALGAAAEAARRFARKNPEKTQAYLDKAASFADSKTKGKYSSQIRSATDKAGDAALGRTPGQNDVPGEGRSDGQLGGGATPPPPPPSH